MNIDTNILNKILNNQILQYKERFANNDQMGHIQQKQCWFDILPLTNLICHIKLLKSKTTMTVHDHLTRWRKYIWENPTPSHDKITKKAGIEENLINHIKSIYKRYRANIILVKHEMLLPQDQEQNKDYQSHHVYSTLCWMF